MSKPPPPIVEEFSEDGDTTPPPHDLGLNAHRAWEHAERLSSRMDQRITREVGATVVRIADIEDKFTGVVSDAAKRLDSGLARIGTRLEVLEARQARTEVDVGLISGRDGNGGELAGLKEAVKALKGVRWWIVGQVVTIAVMLVVAAIALYSRIASLEERVSSIKDRESIFEQRLLDITSARKP